MNADQKAFDKLDERRINQISLAAGKEDPSMLSPLMTKSYEWIVYYSFVKDYRKYKAEGKKVVFETPFDG